MPIPMMPLTRNTGRASPPKPIPKPKAQMLRKSVAKVSRQKLASVPPIILADRWPQTTETENKIVDRNAANTGRTVMIEGAKLQASNLKLQGNLKQKPSRISQQCPRICFANHFLTVKQEFCHCVLFLFNPLLGRSKRNESKVHSPSSRSRGDLSVGFEAARRGGGRRLLS